MNVTHFFVIVAYLVQ